MTTGYYMYVALDLVLDDAARWDYGNFTTAADYLNQMDLGQHFVRVCANSYCRPAFQAALGHATGGA